MQIDKSGSQNRAGQFQHLFPGMGLQVRTCLGDELVGKAEMTGSMDPFGGFDQGIGLNQHRISWLSTWVGWLPLMSEGREQWIFGFPVPSGQ